MDTNLLLRIAVRDDLNQAAQADRIVAEAEKIIVSLPVLCEFAWVMTRGYGFSPSELATAIRALLREPKIVVEGAAVEVGLALLDLNADFPDGIIAHEGFRLGAEFFCTFDRRAARRLSALGLPVHHIAR